MYTNPSNIIKTLICLLERNIDSINNCIAVYDDSQCLTIFEGMRQTLPGAAFPSLEIEPTSASNEWATVQSQRPRYSFNCTFTVMNSDEDYGVEYPATIASRIVEIMTSPENLQLQVLNETRWSVNGGLVETFILDSLVEDVTYNALKEGTIRTVEFTWFALIHEPYPNSKFLALQDFTTPTVLRPKIVS